MHVVGFGCTDFDEFVRMALFLVDSGTLLSQSHYASTPGGAGFQKALVFGSLGSCAKLFYGPLMGIFIHETVSRNGNRNYIE